jgi:hypothetical protein
VTFNVSFIGDSSPALRRPLFFPGPDLVEQDVQALEGAFPESAIIVPATRWLPRAARPRAGAALRVGSCEIAGALQHLRCWRSRLADRERLGRSVTDAAPEARRARIARRVGSAERRKRRVQSVRARLSITGSFHNQLSIYAASGRLSSPARGIPSTSSRVLERSRLGNLLSTKGVGHEGRRPSGLDQAFERIQKGGAPTIRRTGEEYIPAAEDRPQSVAGILQLREAPFEHRELLGAEGPDL